MHTATERAPKKPGIVVLVTKAPKYANIDYVDYDGGRKSDKSSPNSRKLTSASY